MTSDRWILMAAWTLIAGAGAAGLSARAGTSATVAAVAAKLSAVASRKKYGTALIGAPLAALRDAPHR